MVFNLTKKRLVHIENMQISCYLSVTHKLQRKSTKILSFSEKKIVKL